MNGLTAATPRMSISTASGAAHGPELRPDSPAQAEKLVAAGVPTEAVPGLGPNEKAILRLAINPHSGSAQVTARLLTQLPNLNIRADVPSWLRAEAVRSIVAQSRVSFACPLCSIGRISPALGRARFRSGTYEWHCWREQACSFRGLPEYEPDSPDPFESLPKRFWLTEGGPVVIPSSGDGHKRVENAHPIQRLQDGITIEFEIPPWLFQWEMYLLAYLPHAMREVFREDDFHPPPMWAQSGAPGGLLSLQFQEKDEDGNEQSPFGEFQPDLLRDTTAGDALLSVLLSELSVTERFIYRASTEGKATPRDLEHWLGEPADTLRKRRDRLYELALTSPSSAILESKIFGPWQPDRRPGPYDERSRELYERFRAQCKEWRDWSPQKGFWHGLARTYGRYGSGGAERLLEKWAGNQFHHNSALRHYGEGKSLKELGRRAWTQPTIGPREREPMSQGVYSSESAMQGEGCDRDWAPRKGMTRGTPYARGIGEGWDKPAADGEASPPSRELKPRCLEQGCVQLVKELYESRSVPPTNTETRPSRVAKPKEKTDAHRYCKRHLHEREEMREVTQAEITASFSRLDSKLEAIHEEHRQGISQMLTVLTWRFPDDEELLDAVDAWRREIGETGVKVLAE